MQPPAKHAKPLRDEQITDVKKPDSADVSEDREERDQRLLVLLGEVIRMSQEWVRALEEGDPFTADKYEAKCMAAMERFEASRKKDMLKRESFEQTR